MLHFLIAVTNVSRKLTREFKLSYLQTIEFFLSQTLFTKGKFVIFLYPNKSYLYFILSDSTKMLYHDEFSKSYCENV